MKASSTQPDEHVKLALLRNFEFKVPLVWLLATPSAAPASERRAQGGRGRRGSDQQTTASF